MTSKYNFHAVMVKYRESFYQIVHNKLPVDSSLISLAYCNLCKKSSLRTADVFAVVASVPPKTSWCLLNKLPILSSTHLPPYFPTLFREIHAKTRALLLRICKVNCDWSLTADVTEIFSRLSETKGRTIKKLMRGEGNFRAAGTFFRYQIPCMNFF